MFDRNAFSVGLIIGILLPLIGFPIFYGLFHGLESLDFMSDTGFRPFLKERTAAIIAIALNAIVLNIYNKKKYTETMRGVVIPTFVYVLAWILIFGKTIF